MITIKNIKKTYFPKPCRLWVRNLSVIFFTTTGMSYFRLCLAKVVLTLFTNNLPLPLVLWLLDMSSFHDDRIADGIGESVKLNGNVYFRKNAAFSHDFLPYQCFIWSNFTSKSTDIATAASTTVNNNMRRPLVTNQFKFSKMTQYWQGI